jgi:porphobilinogen synthase
MCLCVFIVCVRDFIYPLFIHEEDYQQEIPSMPGCFRHSLRHMMMEVEEAMR